MKSNTNVFRVIVVVLAVSMPFLASTMGSTFFTHYGIKNIAVHGDQLYDVYDADSACSITFDITRRYYRSKTHAMVFLVTVKNLSAVPLQFENEVISFNVAGFHANNIESPSLVLPGDSVIFYASFQGDQKASFSKLEHTQYKDLFFDISGIFRQNNKLVFPRYELYKVTTR